MKNKKLKMQQLVSGNGRAQNLLSFIFNI